MSEISPHDPQWQPPFCPNPNCKFHNPLHDNWRYKRHGYYTRLASPHRIRRFLCLDCRVSFSCQTFSPDYWLKRPHLLSRLLLKTCGGMANRQAARDLAAAPSTVDRQLSRLGRHCLLYHLALMSRLPPPRDITIDGLESFEYSQYFPFHHNLAVDNENGLTLGFTDSPLRRKGRMTAFQKRRRRELELRLGRPDPKAVEKGIRELLSTILKDCREVVVRSDDHPAYPSAMRGLNCQITHLVTSSRQRRDQRNRLWEVNLLDRVLRHASANHTRETLAWSKRRQSSSERLAVFTVWRNCVQWRREKRKRTTPAMEAGLLTRPLKPDEILGERLFPSQIELPPVYRRYYWRRVETPVLGKNRRHELKYAA